MNMCTGQKGDAQCRLSSVVDANSMRKSKPPRLSDLKRALLWLRAQ
jgi:hypothetical protein